MLNGFYCYSSDDTEFIRRFLAQTITHGFSRRRPVRSLQIPPEIGKSPTDFTDLHRFFLGRFLSHADFADDADFFHHRMPRNFIRRFPAATITHGISQRRPVRSLQIPPGIGQSDSPEIQKNLCKCVKSVGQNNHTKKNLRHLRNLRDKKTTGAYIGREPLASGQNSAKFRE